MARLENPLETEIMTDYSLESRGKVHAYLIKEYYLETNTQKSYTSEDGSFVLKVDVVNHQDKPVLDEANLKESITVSIDGEEKAYNVENGAAVISYQTDSTTKINMQVHINSSGNVIHYIKNTDTIELTVPVIEEEPDYTVLWIIIVVLCAVILFLSML